jgi:hypothetical protein
MYIIVRKILYNSLQPLVEPKVWIMNLPFLVKIVENACNFVNSCLIYIKISAL